MELYVKDFAMNEPNATAALRLLQAADEFRAKLAGELSAVHGISVNEFLLLLHLERAAGNRLPRVDLGKRMHVSASTITRMTAPMEKIGLLARQSDERDARLSFVVITEAGRAKLGDVLPTFAKRAGYLFDERCSEDELQQFSGLLRRIAPEAVGNLT